MTAFNRTLVIIACSFLAATLPAAEPAPLKVGIVGIDNYQALAFTELFHDPKAAGDLAGIRVVAAFPGGSPDIEESVQSLPKWRPALEKLGVEMVDTIDKVVEKSDALLVMSVDGRAHLPQFQAIVKAGKPVYIGRPLAASLKDAVAMFGLAEKHNTPLFSCSQHRFSPGFSGMKDHPEVGQVTGCSVYGGCPKEPNHPDLFWHAVHGIETLYTIMGPGCESVTRAVTPDAELLTGVWKDGKIGTFRGIKKGAIKYRAMVFGDKGISPSGDYGYDVPVNWVAPHGEYMGYKGVAIQIAKFFRTRQPPVSAAETIEIFTFMEAAHQSHARGGVPVKLADVLAAVGEKPVSFEEKLWLATPLTEEKKFTAGIEGPACDRLGNIFAVCYEKDHTIGKVTPAGQGEVWVSLGEKSAGNGIVFDQAGQMYVADYTGHNVLKIDPASKAISVFAHEPKMNQPNDLAIGPDEVLWASDPNWGNSTGQLWRIGRDRKVTQVAEKMGTTNGIEVSPDGKTLYVNESVQRNVWAFAIQPDGTLANKRLLKQFPDHGFDGMRCDVEGNLYITRYGKGTVAVLSPAGEVLREIDVLGDAPSNLCFGGPDGRTVYVTEVKKQRLVQFRVDKPGLAWQRGQPK